MKELNFDHRHQKWDQYTRFHRIHSLAGYQTYLVQFASGEWILTGHKADPAHRRWHETFGIGLFFPSDEKCPQLTFADGRPIKNAWLDTLSTQMLLCDRETRHVVAVGSYLGAPHAPSVLAHPCLAAVPVQLRQGYVYWPGHGQPPVGSRVRVCPPAEYNAEERKHLNDLRHQCKMWHELVWKARGDKKTPFLSVSFKTDELLKMTFVEMDDAQRLQLVHQGTEISRRTTYEPYLLLA